MTSIQVFDPTPCYSTEDDEVVMDKEEKRV
jgi:hypothetical protein